MEQASLTMKTPSSVIKCRAAVAWTTNAPLSIEEVEVDPPKAGEVRIKIIFSGVCGTDNHIVEGKDKMPLPAILGHEGAGLVESVGQGVTTVKPGDKVLMLPLPECRECIYCLHPKGNLCEKENILSPTGLMLDGTSRFTCRGKKIYHLYGTSTFTEYTVVDEVAVVKIDDTAPMEKVCIMSCEVPTGFGAVFNTAQVTPGSTCVVFGLGGIGSAIVMACKASGASRIIGVDINEQKFRRARALGVTDCLNPRKLQKPVQDVVMEMTGVGVDFAFEAIGLIETMVSALKSCNMSYGVCVIMGVAPTGSQLSFDPMVLLPGRTLKSSIMGADVRASEERSLATQVNQLQETVRALKTMERFRHMGYGDSHESTGYKTRDDIPKLVTDYIQKKINIDALITHKLPFEKVNKAFKLLREENCIRCVLSF